MVPRLGIVRVALLLMAASLVVVPACAPLGSTPSGGAGANRYGDRIDGEIRSVDTRRGRIQVRESYGGTRTVRYDRRTRVVDGRRVYPVTVLRRGERVRVRVVYERGGTAWADRVEIRRSIRDVRDGREVARRVERLTGTVRQLEARRGYFTVEQGRSRTVLVRIPRVLRREDARRIERLRRGDRMSADVRPLDRNAVELIRFR